MKQAKSGDKVHVSYVGKLDNGAVFDKSPGGKPFVFKIGGGEMIPELEKQVIGMKVGETRHMDIPPEKAFGPHRKEFVLEIPKERIPAGKKVGEGIEVDIGGRVVLARIAEIDDHTVTVDANHPLAGHKLHFDLKLEKIED